MYLRMSACLRTSPSVIFLHFWFGSTLDLDNLHGEDQTPCNPATVAVGQFRRKVDLPLVALHHELHGFRPALDHLIWCEGGWGTPVITRVKLCSIWPVLGTATLVVAVTWGISQWV